MTLPARRFSNDDEAAQYWLGVLRNGSDTDRINAREQLADIFEQRGMFEEATELLISNIHDGVRTSDIFRWLARLYRAQGQEMLAMQSAAEAAKYLPPSSPSGHFPPPQTDVPQPLGAAIIPPDPTYRSPAPFYQPSAYDGPASPPAPQRNVPLIVCIALPLSWLAGIGVGLLFMMTAGFIRAPSSSAGGFTLLVLLTSWVPIAVYWVMTSRSPRHVARRALVTLAVESFALPVAGLVMGFLAGIAGAATAPNSDAGGIALLGGIAAGGLMALMLGCVGFTFGILFLVCWVAIRTDSADR